jgi:hypothetical protein
MPWVGFEHRFSVLERTKTFLALDRGAVLIDNGDVRLLKFGRPTTLWKDKACKQLSELITHSSQWDLVKFNHVNWLRRTEIEYNCDIAVNWDVISCSLSEEHQDFGGICCFNLRVNRAIWIWISFSPPRRSMTETYYESHGRAKAQAVIRWISTAAARVQTRV